MLRSQSDDLSSSIDSFGVSSTFFFLFFALSTGFYVFLFFFFQAEDGIRDLIVTGVQTCALPIFGPRPFTIQRTTWGAAPRTAVRDELDVTATNVASVSVDATRARVSCKPKLRDRKSVV